MPGGIVFFSTQRHPNDFALRTRIIFGAGSGSAPAGYALAGKIDIDIDTNDSVKKVSEHV
ncbi:MAG: hypothetical protein WC590_02920 [Burkholderiaceae bacterium]